MKKNKLKPCPFCGCTKVEVINALEDQPEMALIGLTEDNWNVVCTECCAFGGTKRTAIDAIEAWNRRAYEKQAD